MWGSADYGCKHARSGLTAVGGSPVRPRSHSSCVGYKAGAGLSGDGCLRGRINGWVAWGGVSFVGQGAAQRGWENRIGVNVE